MDGFDRYLKKILMLDIGMYAQKKLKGIHLTLCIIHMVQVASTGIRHTRHLQLEVKLMSIPYYSCTF